VESGRIKVESDERRSPEASKAKPEMQLLGKEGRFGKR